RDPSGARDPAGDRRAALRTAAQSRSPGDPGVSPHSEAMEPLHVLVVDDEPHIGRIIKTKLEHGPFRVTLAYDGQQALDALQSHDDVALVVLDLMMPHVDGLGVLRRMRELERWQRTPIVVLTAAGEEQYQ